MRFVALKAVDRVDFILERAKNRCVLHVGCCDMPFTSRKLRRGTLLHKHLQDVSSELMGFDTSLEGAELMKAAGFQRIFSSSQELRGFVEASSGRSRADVVVLGEVLEHVLSMKGLLDECRSVAAPCADWIVTVPNAVPLKRFWRPAFGIEEVHPDHICYFSPVTIVTLMKKCGFELVEMNSYWRDVGRTSRLINPLLRRIKFLQPFCDGLCCTFRAIENFE